MQTFLELKEEQLVERIIQDEFIKVIDNKFNENLDDIYKFIFTDDVLNENILSKLADMGKGLLNSLKDKYKTVKKSVFDKLDKIRNSNIKPEQKKVQMDKALKGVKVEIADDLKKNYEPDSTKFPKDKNKPIKESTKSFLEFIDSESINESDEAQIVLLESELDKIFEKIGPLTEDNFNEFVTEINEGLFGSIIGGLAGFALGKSIGKVFAKVLGIEKGIFYDMLTSRLVGAALGASLGKKI